MIHQCHKCNAPYDAAGVRHDCDVLVVDGVFVGAPMECFRPGENRYGWHPDLEVCPLCFLYEMFGGCLEPVDPDYDVTAIYGINCPSERDEAHGHEEGSTRRVTPR